MRHRGEQGGRRLAGPKAARAAPGTPLRRRVSRACLLIVLVVAPVLSCAGYSLLTHEEIVDITWTDQIEPLLLKRFPAARPAQLRRAHAYAYGGSLVQDLGYYPFGNRFFSDLTHYVRTGDFVANLIRESADLNQYAFALGALAHYSSDNRGHPLINHAVAVAFPKLRAKYGDSVTYEENPKAHIQTEFGFDITQVAKKRYTSDRYHDFIGFEVSRPVLGRAFLKTYGLELGEVLGPEDLAIGTFRRAVSQVIPQMTRAALTAYHPELVREVTNFNARLFRYNISRAQYEKEWGKDYKKPGVIARVLGFVVRVIPKYGLFQALAFKLPTPQTEDLYLKSVNHTAEDFRKLLGQVGEGNLHFPNTDCDTGRPVSRGEYGLTDKSYAQLLNKLIRSGQTNVAPELRANILTFYASAQPPPRTRKERRAWQRLTEQLHALEAGPHSPLAVEIRRQLLAPPFRLPSPKAKDA